MDNALLWLYVCMYVCMYVFFVSVFFCAGLEVYEYVSDFFKGWMVAKDSLRPDVFLLSFPLLHY